MMEVQGNCTYGYVEYWGHFGLRFSEWVSTNHNAPWKQGGREGLYTNSDPLPSLQTPLMPLIHAKPASTATNFAKTLPDY